MSAGGRPGLRRRRSGRGATGGVAGQGPGAGLSPRAGVGVRPCTRRRGYGAQPGPLWAPRAERPPETVWGHAGDCSPAGASILFLVSLSGTTVWGRTLILPRKEAKAAAVKLGARPPLRPGFTAPQPPLGETVNQAADGLPAEGAH